MPKRYTLPGPVARALEVTGDRWTLLLIRELLLGSARYAELERALPGIPSNLLAERLRLLEDEDIVRREPDGRAYGLTAKGRDLAPVLAGLATWGLRYYGDPSSALAVHSDCGGRVQTRSICARCGAVVAPTKLDLRGRDPAHSS
jgi:DNA-binding HxlR family transcriptional regulator